MIKRHPTSQAVAWFVDLIGRDMMNLDPLYQRRSVWTKPYKRLFIDTIMRNFPAPPIFLNVDTRPDGKMFYDVVDGKQRLLSIMEFCGNEIALPENFGNTALNGRYFSELSDEHKKDFYGYLMSVEELRVTDEEVINQVFDRLNRNVLRLTPQELRHAMYEGHFIKLIDAIAQNTLWEDICISRSAMIRRMKDIEFISDLFLLTMHGIMTTKKNMLDDFYAEYDSGIPDEKKYRKRFDEIMKTIESLNLDICANRLKNYSDFYTLWSVLLKFEGKDVDPEQTRENILAFLKKIDEESDESDIDLYLSAVKAQPNEEKNRKRRAEVFQKLIKTK